MAELKRESFVGIDHLKDLGQAIQEFDPEKILEQQEAQLRALAKPLYELVVYETFRVNHVLSESHPTSITPVSEIRMGNPLPRYSGGYLSELTLEVQPIVSDCIVQKLIFKGTSPIISGQRIRAAIPAYLEVTNPFDHNTKLYHPRNLTQKESAIEIVLLGNRNKILRTDRSVDYALFQKP